MTARGYCWRSYTKERNRWGVYWCSRRKYEREAMQIVRGDYVKLLLKENEKADSKSCSKLKMTSYLFILKKGEFPAIGDYNMDKTARQQ